MLLTVEMGRNGREMSIQTNKYIKNYMSEELEYIYTHTYILGVE